MVSAWPAASHLMGEVPHSAGADQADALGLPTAPGAHQPGAHQPGAHQPGAHRAPAHQQPAASRGAHASPQPEIVSVGVARPPGRHRKPGAPAGYLNPLRAVSGLSPERIDEGVDFAGSGPVYAIGDAVITNASGDNYGWPGGGWITYQLTDGPDAGLMVYLAEDVTASVQAGQHVSASTVIANMYSGGDGIETGWADAGGLSAESQLPEAGGITGAGPFPTMVGLNFEELLQSLGVPAAPNRTQPAYGVLPVKYPANGG